ncbi:antibiotic biosynthesis monooxygenase family protein [Xenorhabdus szentirmaii]|uniref:ABM domain-containing protein n=2 Tax=Xenorhabdus szentirmaii TaxID=290112 RepID=W1J3H4_9GAMM|nr:MULTISPECIES: antibiotic biosynthesis monooxygenase [Xenorhabdus]MBD2780416.1 antibiotic biosynthesis monooxygenase [Xenorhabdus sp. 38]MBD2792465.1 antibiotic biosynthesis monooxygenase [Xenorhabdus sp. CUL]MBD2799735.1 antibiotic biosynthesis monooxygenase [Xenorhabdus sp. M]MBD2805213.1 antibiotic biosynthesis monooxygenase [Xenorhabdus sp. ZM]MBD2821539.1 antibiotic biosynthesis monooxygenase [Xenorhabdus sp. 42]
MLAVIFEVELAENQSERYFDIATTIRPLLDSIPGFISVERFQGLGQNNKYLSLSYWRDEESIKQWRNTYQHREAQTLGRNGVFADYHLKVTVIIRDYGMYTREEI